MKPLTNNERSAWAIYEFQLDGFAVEKSAKIVLWRTDHFTTYRTLEQAIKAAKKFTETFLFDAMEVLLVPCDPEVYVDFEDNETTYYEWIPDFTAPIILGLINE